MNDRRRSRMLPLIAVVTAFGTVGCGGEHVDLASVSGTVTMNGKPLPGATVVFRPYMTDLEREEPLLKGASEAYGKTDENGHYELVVMMTGDKGAVVGKNNVEITLDAFEQLLPSYDSSGRDSRGPNPIPPMYNIETTLEFDVPAGGADDANFDLKNPNFKVPDQKPDENQDA